MYGTKIARVLKKIWNKEEIVTVRHSQADWDEQFTKGNWDFLLQIQPNVVLVAGLIRDMTAAHTQLSVLDVGCGNGALAKELSRDNCEYTGTDVSEVAVEQARQQHTTGTFFQADMDHPPALSKQYDVIVFCEVLLYGSYQTTLEQYRPYLKDDGVIIISLYDAWRTRLIWRVITSQLRVLTDLRITHATRTVSWRICVGSLKSNT